MAVGGGVLQVNVNFFYYKLKHRLIDFHFHDVFHYFFGENKNRNHSDYGSKFMNIIHYQSMIYFHFY